MMSCKSAVRGGIVLLVLALGGCASSPAVHYYTLLPAAASTPDSAESADYRIELLPVRVPQQVDHPQLVIRQGQGGLALVETRQWAAPLGEEIRGALSARLTTVLGAQDISGLRNPQQGTVYRIKTQITRFDSRLGDAVRIDAGWDLSDGAGGVTTSCTASVVQSAAGDYDALVAAQQQAVIALADRVAASVRTQAAGGGCGA